METATNIMLSVSDTSAGSISARLNLSKNLSLGITFVLYLVSMIVFFIASAQKTVGGCFGLLILAYILFFVSMFFIVGPAKHRSSMFDDEHKWATYVMFPVILLQIILSFITFGAKVGLEVTLSIFLLLASCYYLISFIPFCRQTLTFLFKQGSATVVSGVNAAV